MLLLFAIALAQTSPQADILSYTIGPGDELTLVVVGQPEMSGDVRVDADGRVTIPLAKSVEVQGRTLDAAREAITSHLSGGYLKNPQVLLDVKRFASKQIDVSGAVKNPGTYSLTGGDATVSRVLLLAGGLLDPGTPSAEVWRDVDGQRQVIPVDLKALNAGESAADLVVLPGDHLYVQPTAQVFVDGQVGKPGAIAWRNGLTISEAIIQAGSALSTARLKGVYILRGDERIAVNLRRVQRGVEPDVTLQPQDVIVVPESAF